MKKIITIAISALLGVTMMVGLTGCGEKITLTSQTINGITLDVPSDFGAFGEKSGLMLAANEDSTATIAITPVQDAGGGTADAFDQETYQSTQMSTFTDVEFVEFNNNTTLNGVPALYAHANGKNSSGVPLEVYNYILFYEDGTFQSIVFSFSADNDSSLEENIKTVIDSIKIG